MNRGEPGWPELLHLFDRLSESPVAQRGALMDTLCTGRLELRHHLERLLALDASERDFGTDAARWRARAFAEEAPPERIGPWRIERELGAGGMGRVFLAERAEGGYSQRVALKLVYGTVAASGVRGLLRERDILARLEHPGIARLIDGGIHDDGRPWFAMQYIEGSLLADHLRLQRLPLPERLRLMIHICDAVAYAHRQLVVHCDLKPPNVIVDKQGWPHLLDFGIARTLGARFNTGETTELLQRGLTPGYAAPEQLDGRPLGVGTDVYALGCILYEMLTGERPYVGRDASVAMVAVAQTGGEPEPMSQRVTMIHQRRTGTALLDASAAEEPAPAIAPRELRGELDLIAASALRHDPARRYADAGALADDLRRFLTGMPLRAHKDSAAYRARRFVGRHRLVLVVCAAAVLALVATTGFAVRQMQQAHRQAQRAAEVRRFLEDTFRQVGAKGDPQRKLSVSELLDSGVGRLRALPMGPELRAELSKLFGTLYWNIGEYAKAEALIEQAVDTDTGDGVSLQARAAAVAEMAQTEIERAHYGDAHLHALLALELAHRVGTKADEVASDARRELARATIFQGHPDRARAQLLDAIALDRARYGARSGQVADDLIATGTAERKLGHYSAAIADARQAIGILGILPHGSQCRITLAYSSISMAEDLRGDAARAARAARTELARAQANTCNTSRSAIVAHIYLDRALAHQGRYADALRDNQATLALAAPIARLRPEIIADIRASMADDYLGLGQPDEAERQARQSLAQWRKSGSNGHAPMGFPVRRDLASALAAQGHVSDAETILRGLLADQRAIETDDNPDLNWTRVELAKVLAAGHRKDESDRVLQLAREAVRKRDAADTPSRLFAAVEAAPAAHVAPAQAAR